MTQGKESEQFFNQHKDNIPKGEVVQSIDQNKKNLGKEDSKFFAVTISPSREELNRLGKTPEAQAEALKDYVKNDFAQAYAENFNKNLNKNEILMYAKIHYERGEKKGENQMHAHVIISRKTADNKIKISPQTAHKNTTKGTVKGGFDRTNFYENCEKQFDQKFEYDRDVEQSFKYNNAMKNGSPDEIREQLIKAQEQKEKREKENQQEKEQEDKKVELAQETKTQEQERGKEKQQAQEQEQKQRRSRGQGI
jgi:hypothetical protein